MRSRTVALLGGLVGAIAFLLVIGPEIVAPGNLGWTMRRDTQTYVLAWTHFRNEPWRWPIAAIRGVGFPIGTSIGNTDAIPIVAFLLKPFDAVFPEPGQYLGAWLLLCFVLQGAFGALLVRRATPDVWVSLLGAALFVQVPALFNRLGHPALCAHWLLLASIWLLLEGRRTPRPWQTAAWVALVMVAAAVQPYLALMVIALATADIINRAWRAPTIARGVRVAAVELTGVLAAAVAVFWLCGYFLVGSVGAMASGGVGEYSMNLLGPISGDGYSTLWPALPLARPGQYEGLVYFGAGWWLMCLVAFGLRVRRRGPGSGLGAGWLALAACTVIAVSPVVTLGAITLVDLSAWAPPALAIVRSSGRFGWVPMYTVFAVVAPVVASQPRRRAISVLAVAVVLQAVDLSGGYRAIEARRHDRGFTHYESPLKDPAWPSLIAQMRHIALVPPWMCGAVWTPEAADYLPFSLIAGQHGVTINSGDAGRYDAVAIAAYCRAFRADVAAGRFARDTLYVLRSGMIATMTPPPQGLACGALDGLDLCVMDADLARLDAIAPSARFRSLSR